MRMSLIWRPAPTSGLVPATVTRPVGLVDLAPTFCSVADVPAPSWMQGRALPVDDADATDRGFERVLTEWDSELYDVAEDPLEQRNLWDDPSRRSLRDDLLGDLWDHQPPIRPGRLRLQAPV